MGSAPSGLRRVSVKGRHGVRLSTRERNGSKLKVTWVPNDTRSTTAVVSFECYSTVAVGDDETTVIQNAFTEAITDLIEAFSDEVGSEIAAVKRSLLRKLQDARCVP